MGKAWTAARESLKGFSRDNCPSLAAALAYYAIFSLAPTLVLVVAVASFLAGPQAVQGELAGNLNSILGPEGAGVVQSMLQNAQRSGTGVLAALVSLAAIILSATALVNQLANSLNIVWGVDNPPSGFKAKVLERLKALGLILGLGVLMFLFMAASSFLSILVKHFPELVPGTSTLALAAAEYALTAAMATALFAVVFKYLPARPLAWRDVRLGALVTAILFILGRILIGLYLGRKDMSVYGVAGAVLILLLWIYYSSLILFLGAEFTKAWNETRHR